jgi:hypothetical protein
LSAAVYIAAKREMRGLLAGRIEIRGEAATREALEDCYRALLIGIAAMILWLAFLADVWIKAGYRLFLAGYRLFL